MKRLLLLTLLISTYTFAIEGMEPELQMGDGAGNGGDVAICSTSDASQFEGMYTLDYLLTYQRRNNRVSAVNSGTP